MTPARLAVLLVLVGTLLMTIGIAIAPSEWAVPAAVMFAGGAIAAAGVLTIRGAR